ASRVRVHESRGGRGDHAQPGIQRPLREPEAGRAAPCRSPVRVVAGGVCRVGRERDLTGSLPRRNQPGRGGGRCARRSHPDGGVSTDGGCRMTMLTIPDFALVLLIGPSGAGKSTFAARHFLDTEVVSSDECRGLVADDENDQDATVPAFELLKFIVEKRLE